MTRFTRRAFLKTGGAGAAATAAAGWLPASASAAAADAPTARGYPSTPVAKANSLPINQPVSFTYPDAGSPCYLIRMGRKVPGGVGPDGDIVAYSSMCTHMGCIVSYDGDGRRFKCGCHFSLFDPEKAGMMISGQATEPLPQIELAYNPDDDSITATGVRGHLYGRLDNVL